ncbi:MAG: DNA-directed RNA polymerase beta subunit [Candidatus Kapaibacterium sp.]|nr:MAG: DNA-directed RNA polymerase beta subunit [Candidatus Kapabacteria bacterium]
MEANPVKKENLEKIAKEYGLTVLTGIENDGTVRLVDRLSFGRTKRYTNFPDLLDVQIKSFEEFLQEDVPPDERKNVGLQSAFLANFPVEDTSGVYQLEFLNYTVEKPKYSEEECRERELTYAKSLKAKFRLSSKVGPDSEDYIEAIEQEVFLGNIPAITARGTFIINGAERVVVSQLHRSPGVFFDDTMHPNGTRIYSARIIPFKGSWLEFTTDIHEVLTTYVDRKKKFLTTTFLRALGYSSDMEIIQLFQLDEVVSNENLNENYAGRKLSSDVVDLTTGEIIATRDMILTTDLIEKIKNTQVLDIRLYKPYDPSEEPVIARTLSKDPTRNREEALEHIFRQLRTTDPPDLQACEALLEKLFFSPKRYDLGLVGRFKINKKLGLDIDPEVTVLTREDIIATIKHLLYLHDNKLSGDDIDHLGNRRVRTVGEQLTAQINLGLARMTRTIRERMSVREAESLTPQDLVNARTINSVLNQFFGTNQLSQFMDQTNPLAELTHKRRTSALGPGGLSRERAGFEVRDVHYTHYGRLCPIETPEGPNIGLISSLALFARVNDKGFIETPYRKVVNGYVTDEIEYLTAEDEDDKVIATVHTKLDENGKIIETKVNARLSGDFVVVSPEEVQYLEVSTEQITSAAASLIPFLEHDDANRALMGSNMQRQAVPLLKPEAPIVGTGMEPKVAKDSRTLVFAEGPGEVIYVDSERIRIKYEDTRTEEEKLIDFSFQEVKEYKLLKYFRTNQNTCINQKPIVKVGDKVFKGMPIADGAATDQGELALGRNVLVAFMPWRGYNFEDAIVVSERLVAEDVFTSVHLEEFSLQVRDTKRGEEEFTRDIPNVSEEATKDLDEDGIVRVGAKVREGDILIGKITPKGETEPTPEEKLLRAIFGDKAGEVKDASLKAPPGLKGVVINTRLFSRRHSKSSEMDIENKRILERISKAEGEKLAQLAKDAVARLAKLLDGYKVYGLKLTNGDTVFRSGHKVTAQEVLDYFEKEPLKIELVNLENPIVANKERDELLRKMFNNYYEQKNKIQQTYRAHRAKLTAGEELQPGIVKMAKVYIAIKRKLMVGDKMAGRHGNKGIVSIIVPVEDMPFLPDGTPVDIVLNPLGVPSRMNLGQLFETSLGWAGQKLGIRFASPVFDGATWEQVSEFLKMAGLPPDGKTILYDGRTGEPFHEKVTVGVIYMMKLVHMVEDKIHARSIGPYSLITQQPLGGKAQFGGQRLGEMEVWALEAYGAAHTLQEMLTIKSDDVVGRAKAYEAIVKGDNLPDPNIPESFNVLIREMQGLCLDVVLE